MACSLGAVLWNAIGRSNRSVLQSTDIIFFLKNVVNCHFFKDFILNVSDPQIINNRSEEFYLFLTIDFIRFHQNYIL